MNNLKLGHFYAVYLIYVPGKYAFVDLSFLEQPLGSLKILVKFSENYNTFLYYILLSHCFVSNKNFAPT